MLTQWRIFHMMFRAYFRALPESTFPYSCLDWANWQQSALSLCFAAIVWSFLFFFSFHFLFFFSFCTEWHTRCWEWKFMRGNAGFTVLSKPTVNTHNRLHKPILWIIISILRQNSNRAGLWKASQKAGTFLTGHYFSRLSVRISWFTQATASQEAVLGYVIAV